MGERTLWQAALLLTLITWGQQTAAQDSLRVGVRVDAAPFAYKTPAGYSGFVLELCTYALKAAELTYTLQDAQVDDRLEQLVDEIGRPRKYDILCDPTTITLKRARDYVLSVPIFASGGSFLRSRVADQKFLNEANNTLHSRRVIAADGTWFEGMSTAAKTPMPQEMILDCTSVPDDAAVGARLGYVQGTTGRNVIERAWSSGDPPFNLSHFQTICAVPFASHNDAVAALCNGEISYHFGDRDIIDYYRREALRAPTFTTCDATTDSNSYSAEPYAIVISPNLEADIIRRISAGVLQALGSGVASEDDPSKIVPLPNNLFAKYFPDQRMSDALRHLYIILRVPE